MPVLPQTLSRIFSENAERPYLIEGSSGKTLSYAQTLALAASGAEMLTSLGLRRGDRFGIDLANSETFVILYLAALLGGFTIVPLNNALAKKDYTFILEKSCLTLLLTDKPPVEAPLPCRVIHIQDEVALQPGDNLAAWRLLQDIDPDALFSIHFTSGTTSLPKGVPHRVGGLLGNAEAFTLFFGIGAEQRFLHIMPMSYMAGFLNNLLCPLMSGGSVVLATQFNAASALNFWGPVGRHGVNVIWMSPTMLASLIRLDRDETGVRYCQKVAPRIFSATAPLPMKIRQDFEAKYHTTVIESYGLSELLLLSANLGAAGTKDYSVGPLLPAARIEIRAEDGAPLPHASEGAIWVNTPYRSQGYLDYDTGKARTESPDWFDTGDIGHLDEDGYLFVTGRCKDLIIRGGFNISPRTIEELLAHHEGVRDVAVIGVQHDFYGEEIVAVIVPVSDQILPTLEDDLRRRCREQLGAAFVPDRFVIRESLPVSSTGKIQKTSLRLSIISERIE